MKTYFEKLKTYVDENPPCFGDGDSIPMLLYEAYNEVNTMDDPQINPLANSALHGTFEKYS